MVSSFDRYLAAQSRLMTKASLWRVVFVIATWLVLYEYGIQILVTAVVLMAAVDPSGWLRTQLSLSSSPIFAFIYLGSPVAGALWVWIAVSVLHRVNTKWLMSVSGQFNWRDALRGMVFGLAILLGFAAVATFLAPHSRGADLAHWAVWLLPVLFACFVGAFASELPLRGYLQSMLAARFRSPLVWIGVPAAIEVAQTSLFFLMLGQYSLASMLAVLLIAVVAGDVTARTGGIGAAVGLRCAQAAFVILLFVSPVSQSSIGLFIPGYDLGDLALIEQLRWLNVGCLLIAYAAWQRYAPRLGRRLQQPEDVFK